MRLARSSRAAGARLAAAARRSFASVPSWATLDPDSLGSAEEVPRLQNLVAGRWSDTSRYSDVVDPLRGGVMLRVPDTQEEELQPFVDSLASVPKSGLHNPLKEPQRYLTYGEVSARAADLLDDNLDFFARCIQRVVPKSYTQAKAEVTVTRQFLHNFGGDQVRFLARGFTVAGDHYGQMSTGNRFPYGPVAIISPFNFPLEIPVLQLMGALFMGNKPVIKNDQRTSLVLEQFVRLLHEAGMPPSDADLIHSEGNVMNKLLLDAPVRMTQFTGSSAVAEKLSRDLHGKIKIEDAGFDWKILGPDVRDVEYVAWQSELDMYGASGQKCSAQSIMFMHENWNQTDLLTHIERRAAKRNLEDLTVGPVITVTTERILEHTRSLASIPGAQVLFGGEELSNHSIPKRYGAVKPTLVHVPLKELLKPEHFEACTTEIFGPFSVVTTYSDDELELVLEACERMEHHLTASIVSNDVHFTNKVLANTVNGTTYAGLRSRTTAAPQNHWFGPCGDPRGAGIGSPEAILLVWSAHREIIHDVGPVPADWTPPDLS